MFGMEYHFDVVYLYNHLSNVSLFHFSLRDEFGIPPDIPY